MTTINPEIDAAVSQMKAQAARHDDTKTMDGWTFDVCLDAAECHAASVRYGRGDDPDIRYHIVAAMNYYALALSVLPKGGS